MRFDTVQQFLNGRSGEQLKERPGTILPDVASDFGSRTESDTGRWGRRFTRHIQPDRGFGDWRPRSRGADIQPPFHSFTTSLSTRIAYHLDARKKIVESHVLLRIPDREKCAEPKKKSADRKPGN